MARMFHGLVLIAALALPLAACQREPSGQNGTAPSASPMDVGDEDVPKVVAIEDIIETDPRYMIGISYPPSARQYPGLAAELQRYSGRMRKELMDAVADIGTESPTSPYDLSLSYTMVAESPRIVAVAADGSSYTGGAHGNPVVARFVWLPQRNELLKPERLISGEQGWARLSEYVSEQLQTALSQRVDADDLPPGERAQVLSAASKMIEEGALPKPENFQEFEPVLSPDGKVQALRFVFPPYQVGPYSDGLQIVEVPASFLLPLVATDYRDLFAGSSSRSDAQDD